MNFLTPAFKMIYQKYLDQDSLVIMIDLRTLGYEDQQFLNQVIEYLISNNYAVRGPNVLNAVSLLLDPEGVAFLKNATSS